jgi:hypothetical protein
MFESMNQNDLEKLFIVSMIIGGVDFYKSLDAEFTSDVLTVVDIQNIYEAMQERINETGSVDMQSLLGDLDGSLKEAFVILCDSIPKENLLAKEDFLLASLELRKRNHPQVCTIEPPFPLITINELEEILGLTIKMDNANKIITFLAMLTCYTEDSQLNISYNAPSSTGKSYIPTEIVKLFPKEDVKEFGYVSPAAFYHAGDYDAKTNTLIVDLSSKIVIFLDQPNPKLLENIRPLLSHDNKEIKIQIADKNAQGGNRTKNIILKGYPVIIFCTASLTPNEQEATRFLMLSPDIDQEKLRAAIHQKVKIESDRASFNSGLEADPRRKILKERIQAVRAERILQIKISNPDRLRKMFLSRYAKLRPRHLRDISRIAGLVKALALNNLWYRNREGSTIEADERDINEAFLLWDGISTSQEFNLSPYVYKFFSDVVLPLWKEKNANTTFSGQQANEQIGLSRKEIASKYYEVFKELLPDWRARQELLPALESAGLIYQQPDPEYRRKILVFVIERSGDLKEK